MALKKRVDDEIKGIKLSGLNRSMIIITGIMVVCLLAATAYTVWTFNVTDSGTTNYMEIEELSDTVNEASDYLTDQVRLFVETTELEHMELYFREANVTQRRENSLEKLKSYSMDRSSNTFLETAIQESNDLMEREIYAMKLVSTACGYDMGSLPAEVQDMQLEKADAALKPEEMIEKARMMMYDDTYQYSKAMIHENLYYFTQAVFSAMEIGWTGGRDSLSNAFSVLWLLLGILVVINILTFAALFILVMKPLYSYLNSIEEQSMLEASGTYELKYLAQVYNDIHTARENSAKQEAVFKHRSEHDLMTGLQNRTYTEERIRTLLAEQERNGILIVLDLDELKGLNDLFGHNAGDMAIIGIAAVLKSHFRDSDVIGRIGGDEFLVYLPDAAENKDIITLSLNSLRNKLKEISVGADTEWQVHCSMGCAVQSPEANTFEILFKQADTALYHVKRNGKNNFAFYVPEMEREDYQFREKKLLSLQSSKKFEMDDLQYLLSTITSFYHMIISLNLSGNNYYFMEETEVSVFKNVPDCGVLDTFIEKVAERMYPDDTDAFLEHFSRDSLLRAYERGEKSIYKHFRFQHQKEYRWVETFAILSPNEDGDICGIVLLRWADGRSDA